MHKNLIISTKARRYGFPSKYEFHLTFTFAFCDKIIYKSTLIFKLDHNNLIIFLEKLRMISKLDSNESTKIFLQKMHTIDNSVQHEFLINDNISQSDDIILQSDDSYKMKLVYNANKNILKILCDNAEFIHYVTSENMGSISKEFNALISKIEKYLEYS